MGLLDDAIREHLELKRRHGAAEDEVRQQEQEALGPPRRGEVPQPLSAPPADLGSDPEAPALDPPEVEDDAQVPEFEPSVPQPAELEPPFGEPDPPSGSTGRGAYAAPREPSVYADEPWLEESRPAEPPPPAPASPPATSNDPDPEEDVLEETPEFLQETPEHDRLWFEQKPPKDFDFDK